MISVRWTLILSLIFSLLPHPSGSALPVNTFSPETSIHNLALRPIAIKNWNSAVCMTASTIRMPRARAARLWMAMDEPRGHWLPSGGRRIVKRFARTWLAAWDERQHFRAVAEVVWGALWDAELHNPYVIRSLGFEQFLDRITGLRSLWFDFLQRHPSVERQGDWVALSSNNPKSKIAFREFQEGYRSVVMAMILILMPHFKKNPFSLNFSHLGWRLTWTLLMKPHLDWNYLGKTSLMAAPDRASLLEGPVRRLIEKNYRHGWFTSRELYKQKYRLNDTRSVDGDYQTVCSRLDRSGFLLSRPAKQNERPQVRRYHYKPNPEDLLHYNRYIQEQIERVPREDALKGHPLYHFPDLFTKYSWAVDDFYALEGDYSVKAFIKRVQICLEVVYHLVPGVVKIIGEWEHESIRFDDGTDFQKYCQKWTDIPFAVEDTQNIFIKMQKMEISLRSVLFPLNVMTEGFGIPNSMQLRTQI